MPFSRALALALLLSPAALLAQTSFQPVTLSDADALAEQVRRLGANPLDLNALLTAGELSVRLEDLNAAGAFFARAEKIDPRNGRAKAGEAAILVRSQRPGEALRYFGYAEGYGWPVSRFAGDRGLAYDLLGDPGRAQRDYKLALATRDDPETRRRYALSLGIAGRQAQALEELGPLIRQNDRAAWRSRAFVLAMGGNAAEASRIAQTMMPPGAAAGLASFFAELPRLPAVDRAFAVHFGEVRPTPQRLVDARIAPVQAPLALEPLPVQVAAVVPVTRSKRDKRRDRDRDRDRRVQVAAVLPVPVAPMPAPPAYQAPAYVPYVARTPVRDRPLTAGEQASLAAAGGRGRPGQFSRPSTPIYTPPAAARGLTLAEQASLAAAGVRAPAPVAVAALTTTPPRRDPVVLANTGSPPRASFTAQPVQLSARPSLAGGTGIATFPSRPPATVLVRAAPVSIQPPVVIASVTPTPALTSGPVPSSTGLIAGPVLPNATATPLSNAIASPGALAQATPGFSTSPVAPPVVTGPPVPTVIAQDNVVGEVAAVGSTPAFDSPGILASAISTGISTGAETLAKVAVPASEIASVEATAPVEVAAVTPLTTSPVEQRPAAAPTQLAPVVTPPPIAVAVTRPPAPRSRPGRGEADSILAKIVAGLTIPAAELDIPAPGEGRARTAAARRAADRRALADQVEERPDNRKSVATRKVLADKKAAADKRAVADKEAAEARRIERSQPERIWVQVAGGANEAGLAKAWRATKGKAPGVLGGRQAYTTPLRATNRVLTGPFKTDAEARAYVNQLAKAGVSAFTFTSDKGQKITKLDAK